jgi:menaquinone-dependent protoporphyrinogen oxidase
MENQRILLAFATTSGSTQEIAAFVAAELTRLGQQVDLRPCRQVSALSAYDAVVLGAPLYMFHLHRDALNFLKQHRKVLATLPVAIFAGGPFGPTAEKDTPGIQKNLDDELAKFPWLTPASLLLVGGRFDPAHLRFPYNLIPALKQTPASDARNWDEIRAWTQALPGLFGLPVAAPARERSLA